MFGSYVNFVILFPSASVAVFVISSVNVFVILYPLTAVVYPSTASSVTVYVHSYPCVSYFANPVNSYVQFPSSSALIVVAFIFVPFCNKFTVIVSGLVPYALPLSFHVLLPPTLVSGFTRTSSPSESLGPSGTVAFTSLCIGLESTVSASTTV